LQPLPALLLLEAEIAPAIYSQGHPTVSSIVAPWLLVLLALRFYEVQIMKNEVKQRICGGTFFTLLLQARKQRMGVRDHYLGETDGLSDPQALIALIKVAVPDYSVPTASMMATFKGNTSRYKSCQNNGGTYMPFNDTVTMRSFDRRILSDYSSALLDMAHFVDTFLDVGTSAKKDEWLVKALLELLSKDDSIDGEQSIYAREDGTAMSKSDILSANSICFQSFLLGIWHFVLINRTDNRVGRETNHSWCQVKSGSESALSSFGETITKLICISYFKPESQTAEHDIADEDNYGCDDEPEASAKSADTATPEITQPVENNCATFFNFNVTGNNNSFFNQVDTVIINNGGHKDER
jgi:hypothetical protein